MFLVSVMVYVKSSNLTVTNFKSNADSCKTCNNDSSVVKLCQVFINQKLHV